MQFNISVLSQLISSLTKGTAFLDTLILHMDNGIGYFDNGYFAQDLLSLFISINVRENSVHFIEQNLSNKRITC